MSSNKHQWTDATKIQCVHLVLARDIIFSLGRRVNANITQEHKTIDIVVPLPHIWHQHWQLHRRNMVQFRCVLWLLICRIWVSVLCSQFKLVTAGINKWEKLSGCYVLYVSALMSAYSHYSPTHHTQDKKEHEIKWIKWCTYSTAGRVCALTDAGQRLGRPSDTSNDTEGNPTWHQPPFSCPTALR